ncbi:MAG TPA: hypothetical protein VK917_02110 [Ilumatobacter sp.]|nr:hypothetical protein [Ilumatobacter sp.]
MNEPTDARRESFTEPDADRPPTEAEEAAAERAAERVDVDQVAEHFEDAMKTGAKVKGEGEIEPS